MKNKGCIQMVKQLTDEEGFVVRRINLRVIQERINNNYDGILLFKKAEAELILDGLRSLNHEAFWLANKLSEKVKCTKYDNCTKHINNGVTSAFACADCWRKAAQKAINNDNRKA